MVKVWRLVPKERDRRGYELVGVFSTPQEANEFITKKIRAERDNYVVGTPKKEVWWKRLFASRS